MQIAAPQPPLKVDLELRLTTAKGLLAQDLRAAQRSVSDKIADYFQRLPAKDPASINQLVGLALGVDGVEDVKLVSATSRQRRPAAGRARRGGRPARHRRLRDRARRAAHRRPEPADDAQRDRLVPVVGRPGRPGAIRAALTDALSTVNAANESDDALTLSFGQLLATVPLPGRTAAPISIPAGGSPPTETDVAPYEVTFVLTLESGLSVVLDDHTDTYAMTPYERLALGNVEGAASG